MISGSWTIIIIWHYLFFGSSESPIVPLRYISTECMHQERVLLCHWTLEIRVFQFLSPFQHLLSSSVNSEAYAIVLSTRSFMIEVLVMSFPSFTHFDCWSWHFLFVPWKFLDPFCLESMQDLVWTRVFLDNSRSWCWSPILQCIILRCWHLLWCSMNTLIAAYNLQFIALSWNHLLCISCILSTLGIDAIMRDFHYQCVG